MRRLASLIALIAFLGATACSDEPVPTEPEPTDVASAPAFSVGPWDYQVSGGATVFTNYPTLEITVAAKDQDGSVKGQATYRYFASGYARDWHGEADCLTVYESYTLGGVEGSAAAIGGTLRANDGSDPAPAEFEIWIFDNPSGPDRVRFLPYDNACAITSATFPAIVGDGEYHVRQK